MTNQSSLKAASFPPASIKAVMNIITAHLEHGVSASFVNIMRTIREQKRNGSIKLSNREIKALFDFLVATGFLKRQNDETFVISNTLDHDGGLPKQGLSSGRKAKSIQDDEFGSCIQRGIKSNNDKDYDSAILAYRRALEIEPRSSAIWNCLGVSLCNKNDFQGAATAFQEAIKLNPADKLYWSNFGTALFNQGDFNKAIEVLNKSLAIDKNNALIWQLLGLSFDKLDNFDSMIDAFQHGLQLAQGSVKDAMIGWLEEKSDHIGYTDWEKHVRIYKLLAMIPGTAKYKHEYVHRLVMAGCYREALEMAKKYQDSFQDAFLRIENKILQVFCFLLLNEMDNATSAYPTPAELQQHHLAFRYNRAIHHNLYYVLFQRCKELCGLQGTELAGALYFHETSGVEFDDHLKILKNWYEIIRSVREYFAWRLVRPFYENQQQNLARDDAWLLGLCEILVVAREYQACRVLISQDSNSSPDTTLQLNNFLICLDVLEGKWDCLRPRIESLMSQYSRSYGWEFNPLLSALQKSCTPQEYKILQVSVHLLDGRSSIYAAEDQLRSAGVPFKDLPEPTILDAKVTPVVQLKHIIGKNIHFAPGTQFITVDDVYLHFSIDSSNQGLTVGFRHADQDTYKGVIATADGIQRSMIVLNHQMRDHYHITYRLNDVFLWIGEGKINRHEKITCLALEMGKKKPMDKLPIQLVLVSGSPGKSITVELNGSHVPACSRCDGILLSDPINPNNDEIYNDMCPYCGNPLIVYWRKGKIVEIELAVDVNKRGNVLSHTVGRNVRGSYIPVLYGGITRHAVLPDGAAGNLLASYASKCPNQVIGPIRIEIGTESLIDLNQNQASYGVVKNISSIANPQLYSGVISMIDRTKITNQGLLYDPTLTMTERLSKANSVREMGFEAKKIELSSLLTSKKPYDARMQLTGAHLRMSSANQKFHSHRGDVRRKAYFLAKIHDDAGNPVMLPTEFHLVSKIVLGTVTELTMNTETLQKLIDFIQTGASSFFSEVKFHVLESTVQYKAGPIHQYLKPILNEPGKVTKVSKTRRAVSACKSCDTMLLRYSYDYQLVRDDFLEKTCPYCGKNLEIIERKPRIVPVILDTTCKDCSITGLNNQIGVIYHHIPVKLTIKVQSLLYFIQNYEALFPSKTLGPFSIRFDNLYGRNNLIYLHQGHVDRAIDWRPVVLYPEDLIAF